MPMLHLATRTVTGTMSATSQAVKLQSWTEDVKKLLPPNASCASKRIELRTEFSGACTAEFALQAAASACESPPEVNCASMGDWSSAARCVAELNCAETCRFQNILTLASDKMQSMLMQEKKVKAGHMFWKL